MTRGNSIRTIVVAAAALAAVTLLVPQPAMAHGRGGFRGPVFVGGGYYGYPYYGFGWGYPFYGYGPAFRPEGGLDPSLAAVAGLGAINMDVKPGHAEVWVDGRYYGEARDLDGDPSFLWLPEGTHHLTVYKGGYASYDEDVDVRRGLVVQMKFQLEKGDSPAPGEKPGPAKANEATSGK